MTKPKPVKNVLQPQAVSTVNLLINARDVAMATSCSTTNAKNVKEIALIVLLENVPCVNQSSLLVLMESVSLIVEQVTLFRRKKYVRNALKELELRLAHQQLSI